MNTRKDTELSWQVGAVKITCVLEMLFPFPYDPEGFFLRDATPGAGSYVNETDYFEPDWKRAFWGENYEKLLAIKRKYDPHALFFCHHCVGSDEARAKH